MCTTSTWCGRPVPSGEARSAPSPFGEGVHRPTAGSERQRNAPRTCHSRHQKLWQEAQHAQLGEETFDESEMWELDICIYGDVERNPGPSLSVVQVNVCGLTRSTLDELKHYANNAQLVLIQETKCKEGSACPFLTPDLEPIANHRNYRGGGVAIYVSKAWRYNVLEKVTDLAGNVEYITLRLTPASRDEEDQSLLVTCIYCPRETSADRLDQVFQSIRSRNFEHLPYLCAGDFNSHHTKWEAYRQRPTITHHAQDLVDLFEASTLEICNDPRVRTRPRSDTSPDLTLVRGANVSDWKATELLSSDHCLISYKISWNPNADLASLTEEHAVMPHRSLYNFRKANWTEYQTQTTVTEDMEKALNAAPSISAATELLSKWIQDASSTSVPKGKQKVLVDTWSPEMKKIFEDYHAMLSTAVPQSGEAAAPLNTAKLCLEKSFKEAAQACSNERFAEFCAKLSPTSKASWRSASRIGANNQSNQGAVLQDGNRVHVSDKAKAKVFAALYASVSSRAHDAPHNEVLPIAGKAPQVSILEVEHAVKALQAGKASGPDGIHPEHLHHLHSSALKALQRIYNRSIVSGKVPHQWKQAEIIPLPKAGKDPQVKESYRPVSLTSCMSKPCETIMSIRGLHYIALPESQFGFRADRSTADALAIFIDDANSALKRNAPFGAVFVDLSRAFDKVDHGTLIRKLEHLKVPRYWTRWIQSFLRHRRARVRIGSATSEWEDMTAGVPQGTILGPFLFSVYVMDLLNFLGTIKGLKVVCYADDLTIYASESTWDQTQALLQHALDEIVKWTKTNFMEVSTKTVCTAFSKLKAPPQLALLLDGKPLTSDPNPKLLGVTIDSKLTMDLHVANVINKCKKGMSQLAKISTTSRGPRTQDLRTFALAFIKSHLTYAANAWIALVSLQSMKKLDSTYRQMAVQIAGVSKTTPGDGALLEANLDSLKTVYDIECANGKKGYAPWSVPKFVDFSTQADPIPPEDLVAQDPEDPSMPWTQRESIAEDKEEQKKRIKGERKDRRVNYTKNMALHDMTSDIDWLYATDGSAHLSTHQSGGGFIAFKRTAPPGFLPRTCYEDEDTEDIDTAPFSKIREGAAPASSLGCSFHAECVGLQLALHDIYKYTKPGEKKAYLILTDSQSLVMHLKGPLACYDGLTQGLWNLLAALHKRVGSIRIKFVRAHMGNPWNTFTDRFVGEETRKLSQHSAPIWATDMLSAIRRHARKDQYQEGYRFRLFGQHKRAPLNTGLSRREETRAAQLRCEASPEVGRLRFHLKATLTDHCRWCRADAHQQRLDDLRLKRRRLEEAAAVPYHEPCSAYTKREGKEAEPTDCPHCGRTCKGQWGLYLHFKYCKSRNLPNRMEATLAQHRCVCGAALSSTQTLNKHQETCPKHLATLPDWQQAIWRSKETHWLCSCGKKFVRRRPCINHMAQCAIREENEKSVHPPAAKRGRSEKGITEPAPIPLPYNERAMDDWLFGNSPTYDPHNLKYIDEDTLICDLFRPAAHECNLCHRVSFATARGLAIHKRYCQHKAQQATAPATPKESKQEHQPQQASVASNATTARNNEASPPSQTSKAKSTKNPRDATCPECKQQFTRQGLTLHLRKRKPELCNAIKAKQVRVVANPSTNEESYAKETVYHLLFECEALQCISPLYRKPMGR